MSKHHLHELGLTPTWNADDREACREHHRAFYERLKARHGGNSTPAHKITGLLSAVEDLLEDGYSLTDVSVMFGVSRERVRQWTAHYDLGTGARGTCYRIWDDDRLRFVPVSKERMSELARECCERRARRRRNEADDKIRRWHLQALKNLAKRFGRTPTLAELEDEVGQKWPQMARLWGYDSGSDSPDRSYSAAYANLCDAAHVPPRSVGGSGHVS